ncbi:hypothetical protein SAMN05444007_103334 [Cribrihabitans marinus]|uniref:Uncharacterized protein n=1 Tax=Cribrihabitans marinus TaxID=1227549 RepID=A0A1H6W0W1_9RHOB|nr:hypothetical protein [Cribrihabitans marinus]GGH24846.1 hypothetical protein GCM10010973_11610 [Cribrihabitans marinus]SEJ10601.1 hypothetical protein SAMN05444007_103334 [Cribrihabitans marinus]
MLGFLDFLGTVGGNILSLPGIVGLALGMATRNWIVAVILGAGIGVVQMLLFGGMRPTHATFPEYAIAIAVGIAAALVGCAIRHKGATV